MSQATRPTGHNIHAQRNTVKARHYLNIGTLLHNTARQSKTQDRQSRSYLRLTRQSCRNHGHYTVHTTNMPRWHPIRASKTLKAYILLPFYSLLSLLYLASPIHLSPTENSRLCGLVKYIIQPADSPCGQLSITRDCPRKSLTVHNRYHR